MPKRKQKTTDIATKVMSQLKKRDVKMHSRAYFSLITALTGVGLVAATLATIYLVHNFTYLARSRAVASYLGYGGSGWQIFLEQMPWGWLALAIGALGVVLFLLRRYEFSHRHNFYAVIGGAIIALVLVGAVSSFTGVRPPGRPEPGPRPPRGQDNRTGNRLVGTAIDIRDSEFNLITRPSGKLVRVVKTSDTLIKHGISERNEVEVLGEWDNQDFKAKAIRPLHAPKPHGHEINHPH
jgi:hypothetical protein